jgi:hypothetical protein
MAGASALTALLKFPRQSRPSCERQMFRNLRGREGSRISLSERTGIVSASGAGSAQSY